MDDGQAFEANAKSPEVVQPTDRPFDDPTGFAQAAPMQRIAPRNQSTNTLRMEWATIFVVVVSAVGLNDSGFAQRTSRQAADGRNRGHQRQQLGHIVAIGSGQDNRERDALGFGDEVMLGTRASAISGVRSCF